MTITYKSYPDDLIVEKYIGHTLCDREENYYDDSDGYSHVWTPEGIQRVGTWTTRCNSGHVRTTVDAYDEDGTDYPAMREAHIESLISIMLRDRSSRYDDDKRETERIIKGARVTVYKGKKVAKGTEGVIFWRQGSDYHYNYRTRDFDVYRIGIRDDEDNVHWTTDNNVRVTNPDTPSPEDYPSENEMRESISGLSLKDLHGRLCAGMSRLRRI